MYACDDPMYGHEGRFGLSDLLCLTVRHAAFITGQGSRGRVGVSRSDAVRAKELPGLRRTRARSLWQSGHVLKALPTAHSALQLAPNSLEALSVFTLLNQLQNR